MDDEHLFRIEIIKTLGLLREGISTHISDNGGGKDLVFRGVISYLEQSGFQVFVVTCLESLADVPLEALRLSNLWSAAALPETASLTRAILRSCEVIQSNRHPVIAVSDLEWIDAQTWAALEMLRVRAGITLFTTGSHSLGSEGKATRALANIAWPSAEVAIEELTFTAVNSLVEQQLGNPVEYSLLRRVYLDTRGHYTLILYLVESGRRSGRIHLRDGRWIGARDLWSPLLEDYLRSYLRSQPPRAHELLQALSVMSFMTREEGERQFSEELIQGLRAAGLILVVSHKSGELLQVSSPLIARYFAERTGEASRSRILDKFLTGTAVDRGPVSRKWIFEKSQGAVWPDSHPVFHHSRSENLALAESTRNHGAAERARLRQEWEAEPNCKTALAYMRVLSLCGDCAEEVRSLFEGAEACSDPCESCAELAAYRLTDAFFRGTDPELIIGLAAEAVERFPMYANWIIGDSVYLAHRLWPSTRMSELLRRLGLEDVATDLTIEVRADQHWNVVPVTSLDGAGVRAYLHSQIEQGEHLEVVGRSLDLLEESLFEMDMQGIVLHAYSAVIGLCFTGRISEAKRILEMVCVFEAPGGIGRYFFKALHIVNAVLAYLGGNLLECRRLIDHAESLGIGDAGMPGLAREIPEALKLFAAQEPAGADQKLLAGIRRCLDNEWRLGAFFMAFLYAHLSEHIQRREQLVGTGLFDGLSPRLIAQLDLHLAVRGGSAEELVKIADRLQEEDDSYFASLALGFAEVRAQSAGDRKLASELALRRANLGVDAVWEQLAALFRSQGRKQSPLTSRETEIALQAAERSSAEIARRFSISQRTVENHLHRAMRKLNVSTRQELADAVLAMPPMSEERPGRSTR